MAHDRLAYLSDRPDLASHGRLAGEYWYRPGEFLVHEQDVGRIEHEFSGFEVEELTPQVVNDLAERAAQATGVPPRPAEPGFEAAARRRLARFRTSPRMSIPGLVERFRQRPGQRPEDPDVRVAPHYVLMSVQAYQGQAVGEPEPATEDGWRAADRRGREGAAAPVASYRGRVAVLDTGVAAHAALEGQVVARPEDAEVVDEDGDGLRDDQAGHGTFVAGRVLARAAGVEVHARRALDSWGITDELALVGHLDDLGEVDVVNLSLGCYTHDNTEPLALSAALEELPEGTVVVAAAGNYAKARPFWPAALKRCLAVAALADGGAAARYTNYGHWVDACAPGTGVVSTFLEHADPGPGGQPEVSFEGWARWSGTSFAAPYVAAAVAERTGGGTDARDAAHRLLRESRPHEVAGLGVVVA